MLTNTDTALNAELAATTIAIEAAERRHLAALRDIARLRRTGQISVEEAAALERETLGRFTAEARELDLGGQHVVDAPLRTHYAPHAVAEIAGAAAGHTRHLPSGSLSPRALALRARQTRVVVDAHVDTEILRWLGLDDDDETLATRSELAGAGLL